MTVGDSTPERLYPIACAPHDNFYAGTAIGDRQVLMGPAGHGLAAVFFDGRGNYIEYQERPFPFELVGYPDYDDPRAVKARTDWLDEIGFQAGTIRVRRFDVPGEGIGIEDRPAHYDNFLKDPETVEPDEVSRARDYESIARWEREGMYVLWWGKDFWMDGRGEVEST